MNKININNNKHYEEQNTTVTGCILKLSENDVIFKGWFILCLETDSEGLHLDGFRNKQLHCHANGNGVWVLSNNDGLRAGSSAQMNPGKLLVGQEWVTS